MSSLVVPKAGTFWMRKYLDSWWTVKTFTAFSCLVSLTNEFKDRWEILPTCILVGPLVSFQSETTWISLSRSFAWIFLLQTAKPPPQISPKYGSLIFNHARSTSLPNIQFCWNPDSTPSRNHLPSWNGTNSIFLQWSQFLGWGNQKQDSSSCSFSCTYVLFICKKLSPAK